LEVHLVKQLLLRFDGRIAVLEIMSEGQRPDPAIDRLLRHYSRRGAGGADEARITEVDRRIEDFDLSAIPLRAQDAVVVATQGSARSRGA
jgi:hypothetical protein